MKKWKKKNSSAQQNNITLHQWKHIFAFVGDEDTRSLH